MLPEVLSNNLCSLRPNEEKLTFSAVFEMNENVKYFRVTVEDFHGKKAFSRAYFAEEFR